MFVIPGDGTCWINCCPHRGLVTLYGELVNGFLYRFVLECVGIFNISVVEDRGY